MTCKIEMVLPLGKTDVREFWRGGLEPEDAKEIAAELNTNVGRVRFEVVREDD